MALDGTVKIYVCSFDVTVEDEENPVISCVSDQPVTTNAGVCTYTHEGTAWNATATDNCNVATITYALTGVTSGMGTTLNGVVVRPGVTTTKRTATEGSGNIDVRRSDVTAEDEESTVRRWV